MAKDNNVQKIKEWKPMTKRPIGRPKTCSEGDVLEDIKSLNVCSWRKVFSIQFNHLFSISSCTGKKPKIWK
jgi:hypothetical protein